MAATFTGIPDMGSKRGYTPRVMQVVFGNGYKQKVPDGINSNPESWNNTFTANSESEMEYYENFFAANFATYFLWTRPGSVQRAYECLAWEITELGANNYTISATFAEWNGLT
jgi:phage-related protein